MFGSTEEVLKMLIKAINKGLSDKWLRIEQEGEIIRSKDNLAVVCVSAYVTAILRQIMKERKAKQDLTPPPKMKKSKKTLWDAIIDKTKAKDILQKISYEIKGKTEPWEIMMPITAAVEAEVMDDPALSQLKNSHPEVKLSPTSFYRLRNPECKIYRIRLKKTFKKMVGEFKAL